MKLRFTERFRNELRLEAEFIAERNPKAAKLVCDRIVTMTERLKEFPQSGRDWRIAGCRELVIPGLPYIVIYEVGGGYVTVLSLFHTSREFPHVH